MPDLYSIFFWYGLINLSLNSISDFKTKLVDDRSNSFCLGIVLTLYAVSGVGGTLVRLFGSLGIGMFLKRFIIGQGDINAFTWIIMGLMMFDTLYLLAFFATLILGTLIIKFVVSKAYKVDRIPYYPVITVAFVLSRVLTEAILVITP